MAELAAVKVIVTGLVQGVLFRDFTRQKAKELGLTGYVRNMPGGWSVELEAEGELSGLKELISHVRRGPPQARVEKATINWGKYTGKYRQFEIRY